MHICKITCVVLTSDAPKKDDVLKQLTGNYSKQSEQSCSELALPSVGTASLITVAV